MPANIPIRGDDPEWKRKVDEVISDMQQQLAAMQKQINYLNARSK